MAFLTRTVGSLIVVLCVTDMLVGDTGPDSTSKPAVTPAFVQQGPQQPAAPSSPHRVDAPAVKPPAARAIINEEKNAETVIREALKATRQAQEIVVGNLANANTPGYKRQLVSLATVVEGPSPSREDLPTTLTVNSRPRFGAAMAATHTDVRPGHIHRTGRSLDLAIEGDGYFEVAPADDSQNRDTYFTRCGRFELDTKGRIILRGAKRDWLLCPITTVRRGASKIDITSDGVEYVSVEDQRIQVGTLQLHSLCTDWALIPCGDAVFLVRYNGERLSGLIGMPGIEGLGELRQGSLEDSNVDPQEELEELQKLRRQADALEQAARLLHPASETPEGHP